VLSAGDVLCPDLSYVQPARLAQAQRQGSYPILAPDLVIEIISPTDVKSKVAQKLDVYRANGVRLMWVIWPAMQTIDVWRPGAPVVTLRANDTLDGADVIPGWSASVSEVFSA
jgi:Uma2 family endonuclease